MKLHASEIEKLQVSCTISQWSTKNKQRVVSDSLESVLKEEGVIITKRRMLLADGSELYSAKFNVGSQKVVIERSGNELCLEELAISALMCIIVYEGYKTKIVCNGRTKTFNF
jgi:hypothetical protein